MLTRRLREVMLGSYTRFWHSVRKPRKDYLDNGNDFEDDYRGCAPFAAAGSANRPYCVESTISGFDHKNCKEVCQDDLCNTNRINKGKSATLTLVDLK